MEHITINSDRSVTVPVELRKIGVQYDHNVNTIEFVGPRYSSNVDLSTMTIYINYILSDKTPGKYKAENVIIDDQDDSLIRFNWTITRNVTKVFGILSCLVCAKKTDEEGNEINHWNTDIFRLLSVSEGMENDLVIQEQYPDIITSLIQNVNEHDAKLLEFSGLDTRVTDIENNVNELKDDLDEIEEVIGSKTVFFVADWVDKKRLDTNCIYVDSTNARHVGNDTFDVSDIIGRTINVIIDNNYTYSFTYGFTTNTDLKIERVTITETAEITVPENAKNFRYFILTKDATTIEKAKETTVVAYKESGLVLKEIKQKVLENEANIFSLSTDVEGLKKSVFVIEKQSISLEQGTINITGGGNQNTTAYLRSTDFLPIKNLNTVKISSGFRVRAYQYYEDKTYVGSVANYNGLGYFDTVNGDIEVSKYAFDSNAKYIRFTIAKVPSADIVPSEVSIAECDYLFEMHEKVTAIDEQLNNQHTDIDSRAYNDMLAYACNNVLCIGDSLTSGAYYGRKELWSQTGVSIDQNYPRVLGRMLNTQVTNAGVSGINAINWYATEYGKYNMSEYDTFVIWLGTNGGYTDTLDTDVNQYDDFSDYAETNTGCLCKIIENIRNDNPNHLMVILDLFAFTESVHNEVLRKISAKYNIPIIKMSDLTTDAHLEMHYGEKFIGDDGVYHANVHFNKYGNIVIADRVKHGISEYLTNDVLKCDFGLTQRTN